MAEVLNTDGWTNLLMGYGVRGKDPIQGTRFQGNRHSLTRPEIESLYRYDGLARRIVDTVAEDATREWIEVEEDTDGEIVSALEKTKARPAFAEALKWGRLYGGSLLVALVDDGGRLEDPLDPSRVRDVLGWRVFDRHQITIQDTLLMDDDTDPRWGEPEWYQVSPYRLGQDFFVHHTRCVRLGGDPLPPRLREQNQGWDESVLVAPYDRLRRMGLGEAAAAAVLKDFIQSVVSVEGLQDMIAGGQEDLVRRRLDLMDMSRSVLNTLLLDSREAYSKEASSVAGMGDLIDQLKGALSAVTGIPITRLFGESAPGLNSTGENDTRAYYDDVSRMQEDDLTPAVSWMVRLQAASMGIMEPGGVKWRPLWKLSEKEVAEVHQIQAQADASYLDRGVLMPHEVAISRFGGGQFSLDTILETDDPEERAGGILPDPEPGPGGPGGEGEEGEEGEEAEEVGEDE